jgi:hypothetical protein
MRGRAKQVLIIGLGLLLLPGQAAFADRSFGGHIPGNDPLASPLAYPGAPKRPAPEEQAPPYAMRYSDEAAQTLGLRDGHMDLFSSKPVTNNGLMPSFSGGLGSEGAMIRLQWRPGF